MVDRDDLAWWWDLAPTLRWTFAKSMPGVPHWYIAYPRVPQMNRADFDRVAALVRTFGEPGKFYRRTNLYLFTPDRERKIWCMFGSPPVEANCNIVNLAFSANVYGPQRDFDRARLAELALPPGRDLGL